MKRRRRADTSARAAIASQGAGATVRNSADFKSRYPGIDLRFGTAEAPMAGGIGGLHLVPPLPASWPFNGGPPPAAAHFAPVLEAVGRDLVVSENLLVRSNSNRFRRALVKDLLGALARLQFSSLPAQRPPDALLLYTRDAAEAESEEEDEEEEEEDEEDSGGGGEGDEDEEEVASKGPTRSSLPSGHEWVPGQDIRGPVDFVVLRGDRSRAKHRLFASSLAALGRYDGFTAALVVQVVEAYGDAGWYQLLASALELAQLNAAALAGGGSPPNVVWALLTDLTSWRFLRVELAGGVFYVSRSDCLLAPLTSIDSQWRTCGARGLVEVVAALHTIMYPGWDFQSIGSHLQSADAVLLQKRDAWVQRMLAPALQLERERAETEEALQRVRAETEALQRVRAETEALQRENARAEEALQRLSAEAAALRSELARR